MEQTDEVFGYEGDVVFGRSGDGTRLIDRQGSPELDIALRSWLRADWRRVEKHRLRIRIERLK